MRLLPTATEPPAEGRGTFCTDQLSGATDSLIFVSASIVVGRYHCTECVPAMKIFNLPYLSLGENYCNGQAHYVLKVNNNVTFLGILSLPILC